MKFIVTKIMTATGMPDSSKTVNVENFPKTEKDFEYIIKDKIDWNQIDLESMIDDLQSGWCLAALADQRDEAYCIITKVMNY